MNLEPDVLLAFVHLYSEVGDTRKSRYYDRLFVHLMRRSLKQHAS
jgi:hypothetical protein